MFINFKAFPPPGVELLWYDGSEPIQLADLFVTDWRVPDITTIHDSWQPVFPPRSVLKLISATVREASARKDNVTLLPVGSADWKVVYISRSDSQFRCVKPSEASLLEKLRAVLQDRLVVFLGAEMVNSFSDQVAVFRNAALILGPHGAGFTNMLWAPEGASVLLFPMSPVSDICFSHMAIALGHSYSEIPAIHSHYVFLLF